MGRQFNELVLGDSLFFLSTFGSPCPDCQWSQPPFATAAAKYAHMAPSKVAYVFCLVCAAKAKYLIGVMFGAMNTAKNEVNGVPNSMVSQLWAFGPNNNNPRKFDGSKGYNTNKVEQWVHAVASEFEVRLHDKPETDDDHVQEIAVPAQANNQELLLPKVPLNTKVTAALKSSKLKDLLDAIGLSTETIAAIFSLGITTLEDLCKQGFDDESLRKIGVRKMRARRLLLRSIAQYQAQRTDS